MVSVSMHGHEVVEKPNSEKRLCDRYSIDELFPITAALLQCGLSDGHMTSKKLDKIAIQFGLKDSRELIEEFYRVDPEGANILDKSLMKGDGYTTAEKLCNYVTKILEDSGIKKGSPKYKAIMEKLTDKFHKASGRGW